MLRRIIARLENFLNPLVRHPFAEQIGHRAYKYRARLFPVLRLIQFIAVERGLEAVRIRFRPRAHSARRNMEHRLIRPSIFLFGAEPLRNLSCIAVFAPMQAAGHRAPCAVAPIHFRFISHSLHPISNACRLGCARVHMCAFCLLNRASRSSFRNRKRTE